MGRFSALHIIGGAVKQLVDAGPADGAADGVTPLEGRFAELLQNFPGYFTDVVETAGAGRLEVQWISQCPTAGLVLLREGGPAPIAAALLLSGSESEQDQATIRRHTPGFEVWWNQGDRLPRPTAIFRGARQFEAPVAAALSAFATSYFAQAGMMAVSAPLPSPASGVPKPDPRARKARKASEAFDKKHKAVIACILTWSAGVIDTVGYIMLYHAFVAHITGDTVSSVIHGVKGDWAELLHRGIPLATFCVGLIFGEIMLEISKRAGRRRIFARALVIEAVCLAAFLTLGLIWYGTNSPVPGPAAATFTVLVSLMAIAMGVQSAAVRKIGALNVATTAQTGVLTTLFQDVTRYLFWLRDRTQGRLKRRLPLALRLSPRQKYFRSVALLTAVYVSYGLGALTGIVGYEGLGVAIIAAPLGSVVASIMSDLVRPVPTPRLT